MDSMYYLFLCLTLSVLNCASQEIGNDVPVPMSVWHENWMRRHGRIYKNEEEKECRFKIFKNNLEYIETVNKGGNRKYKLGVNKFADLSKEEFRAASTGFRPRSYCAPKNTRPFRYENFTNVPSSVDWRKKGVVTPVKDQGDCASCWAFSSVAATEGLIKLKTGKLISLSEQQLIDCDVTEDNRGCHGGFMDVAFKFIKSKGLTTEPKYPYKAKKSKCKSKSQRYSFKIKGYEDVPINSESSLMKAVANQPVSVGIDSEAIQFYESGVFTGKCGTEIDHAVAAVGYGTDPDGTKYWLVKNSWGKSWGEEGYARIERGVKEAEGQCGIAVEASYPVA